METVTILRELWRRRVLVGIAALAAILVGLLLSYELSLPPESRKYEVGIASGRILVDTPDSQVVDVSPKGSDTLGVRANLLANLMTQGEVKAHVAREAGLRPTDLRAGVVTDGELPPILVSAREKPGIHLLTAQVPTNPDGTLLSVIEIEAQAPNAAGAARLASAAVVGLRDYLDSKAATENVSDARRLEVTGFGASQVREDVRGPGVAIALGTAVLVFLCGCAGILVISRLARGWRDASRQEGLRADDPGEAKTTDAAGWATSFRTHGWRRSGRWAKAGSLVRDSRAKLAAMIRRALAFKSADDARSSVQKEAAADPSVARGELWVPGRDESRPPRTANGRNGEPVSLEVPATFARNGRRAAEAPAPAAERTKRRLARPQLRPRGDQPEHGSGGVNGDADSE